MTRRISPLRVSQRNLMRARLRATHAVKHMAELLEDAITLHSAAFTASELEALNFHRAGLMAQAETMGAKNLAEALK